MSAPLLKVVGLMATKRPEKNDTALEFPRMPGLAGLEDQAASLPENSVVPQFRVPYLCEKSVGIPESCISALGCPRHPFHSGCTG